MLFRSFNLSYREHLSSAETILSGRDLSPGKPEVSLEERFARRLGLKIGDSLVFDVQGVRVEANVVNLRRVRWTSFQPNFLILFPEGVLNDAPKTYLASLPPLPENQKLEIMDKVAQEFPNISAIDIRSTVERGILLMEKMRWALNLMAGISLFSGLLVLYAIASRQAETRRWDLNLCKVLGAQRRDLYLMQLTEFFTLGLASASFGCCLSVALSWALGKWIFDRFKMDFSVLLYSILGTIALTILVGWLGSLIVFRSRPAELLQDS